MHFFYIDESGCSGADISGGQEPIFVLGGISIRDKSWVKTSQSYKQIIDGYFGTDNVPEDFELHSHELLSPTGNGFFKDHDRADRNQLALSLLALLVSDKHSTHYICIEKSEFSKLLNIA